MTRGSSVAEQVAHTHQVGGSTPPPATNDPPPATSETKPPDPSTGPGGPSNEPRKLTASERREADREAYAKWYQDIATGAAGTHARAVRSSKPKPGAVKNAPAKAAAAADDEAKKAKKARAAEIERNAALLEPAMSATIEVAFDAVHAVAMREDDPRFGSQRAESVAALWAKVAAPYVDEDALKYLLPLLATTTSAKALVSWVDEIRSSRDLAKAPRMAPVDPPSAPPRAPPAPPKKPTSPDPGGNGRDELGDDLGPLDCPEAHWS